MTYRGVGFTLIWRNLYTLSRPINILRVNLCEATQAIGTVNLTNGQTLWEGELVTNLFYDPCDLGCYARL